MHATNAEVHQHWCTGCCGMAHRPRRPTCIACLPACLSPLAGHLWRRPDFPEPGVACSAPAPTRDEQLLAFTCCRRPLPNASLAHAQLLPAAGRCPTWTRACGCPSLEPSCPCCTASSPVSGRPGGGWRCGQLVEPGGGMQPCWCFPSHRLGIGFGGEPHVEPHLSMLLIHAAPRSWPERQRGG